MAPCRPLWRRLARAGLLLAAVAAAARPAAAAAPTLLAELARNEFSPESTTPVPISAVSVWMKRLLSRDASLPPDLQAAAPPADTVPVAPVRRWLNARRLALLRARCDATATATATATADAAACDVNEVDAVHGLTPLHLAAMSGDDPLMAWLVDRGADPDVMDTVGRKPQNLTFRNFISNTKRWAREAGRLTCDLPTLDYTSAATDADIAHVNSEARRLVGEGEPFLMRGALRHFGADLMRDWNVEHFIAEHGQAEVTVGAVPYATAFNLETSSMTLASFYDKYVRSRSQAPLYVFDKDPSITTAAYRVLSSMVRQIFPIPDIVQDPDKTGGLDGIHFCLGAAGSGAPMHIHGDAVNAVVHGAKHWYVYTPRQTVYSRMPVKEWVDVEYPKLPEKEKPLECVQEAGDIVYVPLDWGHAVLNKEDNTFGFALELLNRRDTFEHILPGASTGTKDEL